MQERTQIHFSKVPPLLLVKILMIKMFMTASFS